MCIAAFSYCKGAYLTMSGMVHYAEYILILCAFSPFFVQILRKFKKILFLIHH